MTNLYKGGLFSKGKDEEVVREVDSISGGWGVEKGRKE